MPIEILNGVRHKCCDNYSNRDMTGWDLSDRKDMDNLVIHGLCLSNETPNAQVLPPKLTGTTFIACNLDNVAIPPGNKLIDCSNRLFKVQEDGHDWCICPDKLTPLEPLNLQAHIDAGLSIDPAKIEAVADATLDEEVK